MTHVVGAAHKSFDGVLLTTCVLQVLAQNAKFGEAQSLLCSSLCFLRRIWDACELGVIDEMQYSPTVSKLSSDMRTTRSSDSFHGPDSVFRKKTEREVRASL